MTCLTCGGPLLDDERVFCGPCKDDWKNDLRVEGEAR